MDFYEQCKEKLEGINPMTDEMLREFCRLKDNIDALNMQLDQEGWLIYDEKKEAMKENPLVNIIHKLNADKARYFAQLRIALDKQGVSASDMDDFLGL